MFTVVYTCPSFHVNVTLNWCNISLPFDIVNYDQLGLPLIVIYKNMQKKKHIKVNKHQLKLNNKLPKYL